MWNELRRKMSGLIIIIIILHACHLPLLIRQYNYISRCTYGIHVYIFMQKVKKQKKTTPQEIYEFHYPNR